MNTLTASSLAVFSRCPRQFYYRYLDGEKLYFADNDRGRLGTQFHRLVELLTPLPPPARQVWLDRVEPQLKEWWLTFCQRGLDQVEGTYRSEYTLQVAYQGWQLTARLDRLVLAHDRYQIWDWKTGKKTNVFWQKLLYPLLVHWGLAVPAEAISLHFWFVEGEEESFTYSTHQQQADQATLDRVLSQIAGAQFPQTTDRRVCADCFFYYHCWGARTPCSS